MLVVLISAPSPPDLQPLLDMKQKLYGSIHIKQGSLYQTCAFTPIQSDSATSLPILSSQLLCENLLFLLTLFIMIPSYMEMHHKGKDHGLALHTDRILFLSSFRFCLGTIAISSISSKNWSEMQKPHRSAWVNVSEWPWMQCKKIRSCVFLNLKPELVTICPSKAEQGLTELVLKHSSYNKILFHQHPSKNSCSPKIQLYVDPGTAVKVKHSNLNLNLYLF